MHASVGCAVLPSPPDPPVRALGSTPCASLLGAGHRRRGVLLLCLGRAAAMNGSIVTIRVSSGKRFLGCAERCLEVRLRLGLLRQPSVGGRVVAQGFGASGVLWDLRGNARRC